MDMCAIGRLTDHHIRSHVGDLCLWKVPVLLSAEVASIQNLHLGKHTFVIQLALSRSQARSLEKIPYPCDFEHEHGRSQDMPCIVAPELDARHFLLLVEVDRLDLVHGRLQVAVCEQLLVRRDVGHLDVVAEHPEEDRLGRVCHVALALEGGLLKEPGQGSRVVKVEV